MRCRSLAMLIVFGLFAFTTNVTGDEQPAGDAPKDLLAAKSVWKGMWTLDKPFKTSGAYVLTVTERKGAAFKGEVQHGGAWHIEGTVKGKDVEVRYVKHVRGREDFVGKLVVRGKLKDDALNLTWSLPGTEEEGRFEAKLEKK